MLWTIVVVLLALWLFGLLAEVGGLFINLLLIGAVILVISRLMGRGRNTV
jgi:hypothetical protein